MNPKANNNQTIKNKSRNNKINYHSNSSKNNKHNQMTVKMLLNRVFPINKKMNRNNKNRNSKFKKQKSRKKKK